MTWLDKAKKERVVIRFVLQRSATPRQPPAQRSRAPWPTSTAPRSSRAPPPHSPTQLWQNPTPLLASRTRLLASPTPFPTRALWPSCLPLHLRPTPTRAGKTPFRGISRYRAQQTVLMKAVAASDLQLSRFSDAVKHFYRLAPLSVSGARALLLWEYRYMSESGTFIPSSSFSLTFSNFFLFSLSYRFFLSLPPFPSLTLSFSLSLLSSFTSHPPSPSTQFVV